MMGSTSMVEEAARPMTSRAASAASCSEKCGGRADDAIVNSDATHMHFSLPVRSEAPGSPVSCASTRRRRLVCVRDDRRHRRWDGGIDCRGGLQQGHRRLRRLAASEGASAQSRTPGRSRIAAKRNGGAAKKRESRWSMDHAGRSPQGNQVAGISRRADARRGARIRGGRPPGAGRDRRRRRDQRRRRRLRQSRRADRRERRGGLCRGRDDREGEGAAAGGVEAAVARGRSSSPICISRPTRSRRKG